MKLPRDLSGADLIKLLCKHPDNLESACARWLSEFGADRHVHDNPVNKKRHQLKPMPFQETIGSGFAAAERQQAE